jgi:erythronate-4-phosphate dehydrogenase
MKIVIDDKIPYIRGVLEPFADVVYLPGNLTTADVIKDADGLITRTRTICNRETLAGSRVKFIATATIGFDHIDAGYCEAAGIEWTSAPGCNAESVNQYISSALFSYSARRDLVLRDQTIGIVGVGQVGSRVAKTCKTLGMNVLLNDPPRERSEGSAQFVDLDIIRQQADIISFHVPLNLEGADKTYHMVNESFLSRLENKPLIINTCRGEVFDTGAVNHALGSGDLSGAIIDCWENEPDLNLDLLDRADFGTAHIAGYSKDGKANGTKMTVQAVSRFFNLGINNWQPTGVEKPKNPLIELDGKNQSVQDILSKAVLSTYKIKEDDQELRLNSCLFEKLRGDYPVRREFDSYSIKAVNMEIQTIRKLEKLGFNILE